MPVYLDEEGEGLTSLNPFWWLERPRQAPSKDPAQALRVVPEGLTCSCVNEGQCSVTDSSGADPDSSWPFAVSSTWLTSWHTVST